MGYGAGKKGFAGSCWSSDEQIVVFPDPLAIRKFPHQGSVQSSGIMIVDVFHGCVLTEFGFSEPSGETTVLPLSHFPVDQKTHSLLEGQRVDVCKGGTLVQKLLNYSRVL